MLTMTSYYNKKKSSSALIKSSPAPRIISSDVDPHHFDADQDSSYHLDADPDSDF
jgi:hypothetical protein